jgi:Uma2 family endonuclease
VYARLDIDDCHARGYSGRMAQPPLTLRRWSRKEYDRLVKLGMFEREPLELIGGELIVAEPQYPYHASGITRVDYALRPVLPPGWIVRLQAPVSLDDESEPEPDLVIVPGTPADYRHEHPASPALVVEVADSSLAFDRARKGSLYARAGVRDYWIVNLVDRVLEVYREPIADASAAYGWRYRDLVSIGPPGVVSPLAFPAVHLAVADLLP